MKITDIKGYVESAIIILVAIFSVIGINNIEIDYIKLSAYGILAIVVIIFIYRTVKKLYLKRLGLVAMSNLSVIKNSNRYGEVLLTFANANQKKLLKNKNISKIKKIRELERHLVKRIMGNDSDLKKRNKIKIKIEKLKGDNTNANALSLIKELKPDQDYQVAQILSKTFVSLERTLLTADQYNLRIKFGHYISTFSNNIISRVKAELDFVGWTYMMKGNLNKGERAIKDGIALALEYMQDSNHQDSYQELNKLVVRGYRHLGSARPTYETKPTEALKYLNEAINYLNKIDYDEVYTKEMNAGIEYGIFIAELYLFKYINKKNQPTKNQYLKLLTNYKTIDEQLKIADTFTNKHRHLKFLVLKSKYAQLFTTEYKQFSFHLGNDFNYSFIDLKNEMSDYLNQAKTIFDNNIYIDESVEYYLEASVHNLKLELINEVGKEH